MQVAEFETQLFSHLYEFFQDHEFELLGEKKQFRRTTTRGFQNVIFSVTPYQEECWMEVHLGTRLHAIEQICQQFLFHLSDHQPDANTIITSLGRLSDKKYFRFKVSNQDELLASAFELQQFMNSIGFAFLDKYYSNLSVHTALNDVPEKPTNLIYNQNHRYFKGLTAAHLIGYEELHTLANDYLQQLMTRQAPEKLIGSFKKLSGYLLEYYTVN